MKCLNCGRESLEWQADYDFEDLGIDGKGTAHFYVCKHCGAEIEVYVEGKDATEN